MPQTNGTPQVNGFHNKPGPQDEDLEQSGSFQIEGIPPAQARQNSEYVKHITIPLNEANAFTPRKKLRVVTIGAGYSGMTLAQKLQHKYAEEMDQMVEHVIYEARDTVGGTWDANTYPGVMCDVPSAIYVCLCQMVRTRTLIRLRHFHSIRTRNGATSIRAATKY
jgi:hypothetical protein